MFVTNIVTLPLDHFCHEGILALSITSGVTTHFLISGQGIASIKSVRWAPVDFSSVLFSVTPYQPLNSQSGIFSINILNNFLDISDRGGYVTVKLMDGTKFSKPVRTFGPPSTGPLWQSPYSGLKTG